MTEFQEPSAVSGEGTATHLPATPSVENVEPVHTNGTTTWRTEAGRKGAERIRDLIRAGRLYEKEHGLTRGRQRIRQLIEQGKLYEQEHGLRSANVRRRRMSTDELLVNFFQSLVRLVKPKNRARLLQMLQHVERAAPN
jgi:hypothetical protein